jgi:hypothetical protein
MHRMIPARAATDGLGTNRPGNRHHAAHRRPRQIIPCPLTPPRRSTTGPNADERELVQAIMEAERAFRMWQRLGVDLHPGRQRAQGPASQGGNTAGAWAPVSVIKQRAKAVILCYYK